MAVVLLMMAVITGLVYFTVRNYMLEEAQERYEGILKKNKEEFRRRLSDVYVAAKNNIHDIERDIDNPDAMYDHMNRIVSLNPTVRSSTLLFAPDVFPQKGRFFVPMVKRDSTGALFVPPIDSVYTYHLSPWYKRCMQRDTAIWVGSYYDIKRFPDKVRPIMLTTYAMPVHNHQGIPVGLLCLQLSKQSIHRGYVEEIKRVNDEYEQGQPHKTYCFVIDRHGNYIMHPDQKRILNTSFLDLTKETPDTLDDRVVAKMVQGENGEAMLDVDGVHSWVYYRTIKYVDWTIVIVVPKEVIFHNGLILNTIILLTMLFGLVAIFFICRHMIRQTTRPLHSFALSADEVALGNFSSPLPDVQGSDEVHMLHDAFENMRTSLSIYVDELQSTTATKASLERELKIAHGIQMALLPKPLATNPHYDLYASLTPAREVGGDFYDYYTRDGYLFFCIGDVSGKGVPAALVMAVTRSLFRSIVTTEQAPERIVWRINRAICDGNEIGVFVTMFVGVLDLTTGHLDYCNAGHEAPLVSGVPLPIKPNLPVGALPDWTFEPQQTQLQPDDMLFLYTDGLSEAKNDASQQFGRKHVVQLAGEHVSDSAQQLVQLMDQEVQRHAGDAPQSDDITLLAIKWTVPNGLTFPASMDEIGRLKPYIEHVAKQAGFDDKETHRLRLAVEEAVANVINYGQATTITLHAETANSRLTLTIDDDGIAFDPTQDSATDLSVSPDQRPPGGLGIMLLHKMTDALSYERVDGHNILTIVKQ